MNKTSLSIINYLNSDFLYMNDIYVPQRVCKTCLMDDTDSEIIFTPTGCNHCDSAKKSLNAHYDVIKNSKEIFFRDLEALKKSKKYCIVGLSGGIDSSYLVVKLNEYGIKTKTIHLDNHWNSPLASDNIFRLVTKLNLDFKTIVLNWEDFKKQQLSLIYANVVDLENATDHAIFSTLFNESCKNKMAPIYHGVNITTENIMPMSWIHKKHDARNLKDIFSTFYPNINRDFPFMSTAAVIFNKRVKGIKWVSALDYFDYDKKTAESYLVKNFGFVVPKRKHEESLITKIYQRLILPLKFNIDKRKAHYSSMIASGQITRKEGLDLISQPLYSKLELVNDLNIFLNKLDLTEEEFIVYLSTPQVSHLAYKNDKYISDLILKFKKLKNAI